MNAWENSRSFAQVRAVLTATLRRVRTPWAIVPVAILAGTMAGLSGGSSERKTAPPTRAVTPQGASLQLFPQSELDTIWSLDLGGLFRASLETRWPGIRSLREESFAWPRILTLRFAPDGAVADFNGDGRNDAAIVLWDETHRRIRIVALLGTDGEPAVHELHSLPAPPDSTDRPEFRTLFWVGDRPRTDFAISLTGEERPGVRWLPASCNGSGYAWTWRFGRFWRQRATCTLPDSAGANARRQRFVRAGEIMDSMPDPDAPGTDRRLMRAEQTLEAALHPGEEPLSPGTGARASADALVGVRAFQSVKYHEAGELDSALAAAGRWQALARRIGDSSSERQARAQLLMVYADIGRPEVVEEYARGLSPADLPAATTVLVRDHLNNLANGLAERGERSMSQHIRGLLNADAAAPAVTGKESANIAAKPAPPRTNTPGSPRLNQTEAFFRALAISADSGAAIYRQSGRAATEGRPLARSRMLVAIGDRYVEEAVNYMAGSDSESRQPTDRYLGEAAGFYNAATALARTILSRLGSDVNAAAYADSWMPIEGRWIAALVGSGRTYEALAASERLRNLRIKSVRFGGEDVSPVENLRDDGEGMLFGLTPSAGSSLVFLPAPEGIIALSTRGETLSSSLHWISDPDKRIYRLIPAIKLLIQQEGGVQTSHGVARLEPIPGDVSALVDSFATRGGAHAALVALADLMLPRGVRAAIEPEGELVIIGHGPIGSIPFSALLVPSAGGSRSPFGERYAIRMSPTLRMVDLGLAFPSGRSDRPTALVLGDPEPQRLAWWLRILRRGSSAEPSAPRLPEAAAEARAVAGFFGQTARTGTEATESLVRQGWGKTDIVHIASHAFVYTRRGSSPESHVLLSPDEDNDGKLHVRDLLHTWLEPANEFTETVRRIELVVLSACESGVGETRWSEGAMGFQRAFLAAGASSVLTSLWAVRDDGTRRLMTSFYSHWLRDPDQPNKAEALRRAQNDLRKIPGYEAPYHWAGFQLAGAP